MVSASHITEMHPKEVLKPFTNGRPAPKLENNKYEALDEKERLRSENDVRMRRTFDDIMDESIASGFWKKFGKGWREDEELRKEVEKWPKLKKHLEEVHGGPSRGRSPGPQPGPR